MRENLSGSITDVIMREEKQETIDIHLFGGVANFRAVFIPKS